MKNTIHTLRQKKWHLTIPYGAIVLALVPASILLLFYKGALWTLNTYFPGFAMEVRDMVRMDFGIIYNATYGTYVVAFVFFLLATLMVLRFKVKT